MEGKIFLIHWSAAEAESLSQILRSSGWEVVWEAEDGARAGNAIKADPPDIVVIYLTRLPSHGRASADFLRRQRATRNIPIEFVNGKPEAVEKTKAKVPYAIYTSSEQLGSILAIIK